MATVTVADHNHVAGVEIRVEVAQIRVSVVPADECRRPDDPDLVFAGNADKAVVTRADGKNDGVVHFAKFAKRDVAPDFDIPIEVAFFRHRGLLERARHFFRCLMIRGNAEADQSIRRRETIDQIRSCNPHPV